MEVSLRLVLRMALSEYLMFVLLICLFVQGGCTKGERKGLLELAFILGLIHTRNYRHGVITGILFKKCELDVYIHCKSVQVREHVTGILASLLRGGDEELSSHFCD